MTLTAGTRIGAHEIRTLLGVGGMGEVYRAHDAALGRDVAIKILPEVWLADADRRARFDREARVLASLNHPHIGAIYGVEEASGAPALVLELVEGPTLEDRLTTGALPVKDALAIARQIADALDAAHEKGIVHRDLKPSNIKITADSVVKVLDFGLAKLGLGTSSGTGQNVAHRFSPDDLSQSPTFSIGATKAGAVLGTAAYMSPEQARGQAVDKRADIWAFGCVLYEMLTGRAVFARNTISDTLVAILEREPDWTVLPTSTPATVRRLLERCLTKDPKLRLRDIGDVTTEIAEAPSWSGSAVGGPTPRPSWWTTLHWVASLILTAVGTGILVWSFKPSGSSPASTSGSVARLVIASPPG